MIDAGDYMMSAKLEPSFEGHEMKIEYRMRVGPGLWSRDSIYETIRDPEEIKRIIEIMDEPGFDGRWPMTIGVLSIR